MPCEWSVGYIPYKRAQIAPDKAAVIFEDAPVTYRELNERTNRCAHALIKKGLKKGDRLAAVLLNCVEFLELYFACAKLGIIFVPLNWRLAGPELEYQIKDSGARMLFFHDAFLGSVDLIRTSIPLESGRFVFLKSHSKPVSGIELPGCPGWAADYRMLVRDSPRNEVIGHCSLAFEEPLAIIYTSGVTGKPKGAVVSHQQTYFKNFQVGVYVGGHQDDVVIAQMPLFHSGGLFVVSTPALNAGMTMVMRSGFDPVEFAEDIQRYRGTIVFALTTMWRFILDSGNLDRIDTSSVRCVVGGGERTPPSLFEELSKRGLYMQQGFGQTENSAMTLLPREDVHRKMGSIGKPGFFTEVWIATEDGRRLPPGEIGEIVARGPTVMSGYWNMPAETDKVIRRGVLYTGDLGYMDEEGYFYIVDRLKDMYRSGGENVYPAEVEKILTAHPKITQAAVIGVPDEKWGEVGMGFIVPARGATISVGEINDFLKGKIARYKHPARYQVLKELPLTATMKVKKSELKARYSKESG